MRCTNCNTENPAGKKFCGDCGAPLANLCPKCGADNPAGKRFCGECGTALGAVAAAAPAQKSNDSPIRVAETAAPENIEGERKTVTALFADIKGSTELEQDLDPEEARAIVDPALKLMIDAVRRYDGYIVQSTGDGIFALFGAPVAHEDHPQRALYAALRMQEELKKYSARLREAGNLPIEARVGVNTGEVVVRSISTGGGHTEYTPIGHTTNLASRMQALAPTGSIAISEATRKFVEGYFALKPLGPTKVKGVSEPVNVHEVTGLGPLRTRLQRSAGRGLTKFVGREREMDAIAAAAERAKSGRGQIVAAMAEAGTGKSRLLFEFKAKNQSGWAVLEAFSVSHGKASAYLPVIDLLWSYFEIGSDDDERKRREKINGKIVTLDRSLEDALPYLYALLGLSDENSPIAEIESQLRKRRTLDAIKRILLRESLNQPLMVIFEDLHWIDEQTQELLNLLADSIGTARIMMLVNYRPEYTHQWGSKTYYTQLRLDPLGKESADEMLSSLLGDDAEVRPLKQLIIEKTEGNPFFMEETVLVLFDEGALVRNGAVKLTRSLNDLKIPPTVQAILAARIDRLPADEKELLQALAVTGKEFSLSLVRAVIKKSDDEISRMLNDLQLAEFIYEQPAVGEIDYTFKHALTQEVAYNSVLIERRKALHERIGAGIETLYRERLDDYLAELAHHYVLSTNTRKAVEYLHLAGRQAGKRSVFSDAISRCEAALELLNKLPGDEERSRKELALNVDLGVSVFAARGWASPEAERIYSRSLELARRVGNDIELCRALIGLQTCSLFSGQLDRARQLGEQSVEVAERIGRPGLIIEAHRALGHALWNLSDYSSARAHLDVAIAVPTSDSVVPAGKTIATWTLGLVLFDLGYTDQATRKMTEAIELARKGRPPTLCAGLGILAGHYMSLGRPQRSLEYANEALALSSEHGFPFFIAQAMLVRGRTLVSLGRAEEGLEQIQEGVAAYAANGWVLRDWFFLELPIALWHARRPEQGLKVVDAGLADVRVTCCPADEAALHRIRGELLLIRAPADEGEAERCFRRAMEIGRRVSARWLELLATTGLARLLAKQGKRDEARAMLANIYGWFTEGFDTADLKDAKALLDELNA